MGYMVFEDLDGGTEVKIHEETCGHVKKGGDTETTKWHGPFDYNEAKDLAESLSLKSKKEWRNAGCCVAKSR